MSFLKKMFIKKCLVLISFVIIFNCINLIYFTLIFVNGIESSSLSKSSKSEELNKKQITHFSQRFLNLLEEDSLFSVFNNYERKLKNNKMLTVNNATKKTTIKRKTTTRRRRTTPRGKEINTSPTNIKINNSTKNPIITSTRTDLIIYPIQSFECGSTSIDASIKMNRIINGDPAIPNSWPWVASLRYILNSKYYHICAGTLISYQHVVTAAHCVDTIAKNEYQEYVLIIGSNFINEILYPDTIFNIQDIMIYPFFYKNILLNDIALIKLTKKVIFSDKVKPICLPISGDAGVVFNRTVVVTGWGSTNGKNSQASLSNKLLQATLKMRKNDPICKGYEFIAYCALDDFKIASNASNICFGDSGGGLMYFINGKWYLYGVTSFVLADVFTKTCLSYLPSFYTIIPNYLDWLKNLIDLN